MNNLAHQICDFNLQGSPSGEAQAKHIAGDKTGFTTTSRLRPEFFPYSLVRQRGILIISSLPPSHYYYCIIIERLDLMYHYKYDKMLSIFKMNTFDVSDHIIIRLGMVWTIIIFF